MKAIVPACNSRKFGNTEQFTRDGSRTVAWLHSMATILNGIKSSKMRRQGDDLRDASDPPMKMLIELECEL